MRAYAGLGTLRALAHRANAVVVCAALVVACTVALLTRRVEQRGLAGELAGAATPASSRWGGAGPPLAAYVVFQLADCDGNLRVLDLLRRRSVREHVRLAGLVLVGARADLAVARRRLPAHTRSVPMRPASRASVDLLAAMGHGSTPIVVVLDAERRVRFVSATPRSPRAYVGLARLLSNLDASDAP